MCEKYNKEHGTDVKPWDCVKYRGEPILDGNPMFTDDADKYTFAISILEAKPVFVGNKVWFKNARRFVTMTDMINSDDIRDDCCSWTPPKRETVIINGVELPRPLKEQATNGNRFTYSYKTSYFHFNDYQEFQKWECYLILLMAKARDRRIKEIAGLLQYRRHLTCRVLWQRFIAKRQ